MAPTSEDSASLNLPKQLFINNQYRGSTHSATLRVKNPADESLIADDVPIAGPSDVDCAVEAAQKAFPGWKAMDSSKRRDILISFAQLLTKYNSELCSLTRLTNGRPVSQDFETQHAADTFMYYAGWTDKLQGSTVPLTNGVLSISQYEPFGVTAGITPWNAPIALMAFKAAPSLAAGNCFILKPSEKTPFSSLFLGKLILEAGFPAGVFQILSGDGSTGELLANHLGIRKISFTGSGAAGRKVQIAAAKSNLKQVTLELGVFWLFPAKLASPSAASMSKSPSTKHFSSFTEKRWRSGRRA
ncbi:hypothetical protein NLG97_g6401 [Lecanicillium saksenae]|uniref:Uncharacterized protein n=1 Tax=Lecanicillium saksenae TaxID=468837 RepID=A0ACC1QPR9_9HYPO|nr:hypothetical protein NLG97_g6401 [Lecanicillium saksenae]